MIDQSTTVVPALRGYMGDWAYYAATMSFADVERWIKRGDEIHRSAGLSTWIQRKLIKKRVDQIAIYLETEPQRFFNAIVVGVYGGEPQWYPVSVGESVVMGAPPVDERTRTAMGFLAFRGDERMFAVDGQHRVEGIKEAVRRQGSAIGSDELCVIFVAHGTDDSGHLRTRRLFSTLNREAKRVSEGEIVALDEDNAFAVVTRRVVDDYPPLSGSRVCFTGTARIPDKDAKCVTTVIALYRMIQKLALPFNRAANKRRAELRRDRPDDATLQGMFEEHCSFWDALRRHVPPVAACTDPGREVDSIEPHRNEDGGHVLFRPAGQFPFAAAVRTLMDRGQSVDAAVAALSATPMDLAQVPWTNVLWDRAARKMITKNELLAHNLFLYMAGADPANTHFDLEQRFRLAQGESGPPLSSVPRQANGSQRR
jgi:DNA sulfur modification protein DndB